MGYFPDLLIETYHELLETVAQLTVIEELCHSPNNEMRIEFHLANQREKLQARAAAIRKRMQSLGYHTCWKDGEEAKVDLP